MLLIFDLDGTLFQAKPVVLRADWGLLRELGVPEIDESTLFKNAGQGLDTLLRNILPESTDLAAARARYLEMVREAILDSGELFPGIRDVLEQLHADGHTLVVCSNSPPEYIKLVLEHTGISGLFTRYCSSEEYASKAEAIRELLSEMQGGQWPPLQKTCDNTSENELHRGEQRPPVGCASTKTIVIGDTHGDVEAAHENGLGAIAVTYGYGNKSMLASAEYFADTPADIPNYLLSFLNYQF